VAKEGTNAFVWIFEIIQKGAYVGVAQCSHNSDFANGASLAGGSQVKPHCLYYIFNRDISDSTTRTHLVDNLDSNPSTCSFLKRFVDSGKRSVPEFNGEIVFSKDGSCLGYEVAVSVPWATLIRGRSVNH
jgi:hypothetical protein